MKSVTNWLKYNIVAIILVLCFIPVYVISKITGTAFEHWGSTSMEYFALTLHKLDIIIVIAFFIFANDNMGSFMTHIFGFVAGIIVSFIMVSAGWINNNVGYKTKERRYL